MIQNKSENKCKIHNSSYQLIGDDQICQLNCLICYDCLKTINSDHKFEGINHKTISIMQIQLQFNKIKQYNNQQIKKCENKLNEYIQKFKQHFIKQLDKQKQRILKNIYKIFLTQITKQQNQLSILQNLFLEEYSNLKCNHVNKISKKLLTFKPSTISKGFKKFNQYLQQKQKGFENSVSQLLKNQNYTNIVLKDVNQGIKYPIFYQPEPQPQPEPELEPQHQRIQQNKSKLSTTQPSSPLNKKNAKDREKDKQKDTDKERQKATTKQKYGTSQQKSILDNKELYSKIKNPFEFRGSQIIKSRQDMLFLEKLFTIKVLNSKLLYRASESNFSIKRFHHCCDGQTNTIVFVKTQFNKIIGGYTPIPWKSTNNTIHSDIKKQSFLFSLTLKQKMQLLDQKSAIFNSKNYGPTFGSGADLAICQNSNIQNTSYSQFPFSYGNVRYIENNQHTTFLFTGQQQGNHFLIKQWEVWKLDTCNQ